MMRIFISIFVALFITSCVQTNVARITPDSLLSSSSENVSFGLVSDVSINSITNWIKEDKPTEADLVCTKSDFLCIEVQNLLEKHSIPYNLEKIEGGDSNLTLIYKRITARDCGTGLGCSVSVNAIQSVSRRSDFISPALSDLQDADNAVDSYNSYFGE